MQVRKLAVTSVVAVASFTALGLSTPAYALCESYSGGCPTSPPTTPPNGGGSGIGGNEEQPATGTDEEPTSGTDTNAGTGTDAGTGTKTGSTSNTPATLPFTGGELVLLTAVGAGALAGGTALVLAGRRRTATA